MTFSLGFFTWSTEPAYCTVKTHLARIFLIPFWHNRNLERISKAPNISCCFFFPNEWWALTHCILENSEETRMDPRRLKPHLYCKADCVLGEDDKLDLFAFEDTWWIYLPADGAQEHAPAGTWRYAEAEPCLRCPFSSSCFPGRLSLPVNVFLWVHAEGNRLCNCSFGLC